MRKISLIILTTLMGISLKAQLKNGLNKFETSTIIKKESEIIVITNDSLVMKNISELYIHYDCYPCHDNNNIKSMMFTFSSKHESFILSCLLDKTFLSEKKSILVEN